MDETEKIKLRYEDRKADQTVIRNQSNTVFSIFMAKEREKHYSSILKYYFKNINSVDFIEIGAGGGANISFFNQLGIPLSNIYANELLESRIIALKNSFPTVNHLPGNALDIGTEQLYDIVFQSTVFTSILDNDFKKELANKMYALTKPKGIILWYDFVFDNPKNKDVKGVSKKEIISLFPKAKSITFQRVTLAPPIGRRIGKLYSFVNTFFPFLRTHVIAVVEKD